MSFSNTTTFGQLDDGAPLVGSDIFVVQRADGKNYKMSADDVSVFIGGGGGGNISSINGDTSAAQVFLAGTGLTIVNAGANHTYNIDSSVVTLSGVQTLLNKTLTAPIIGDFNNASHDHQAALGGSQLVATLALTATGVKDSTTFLRGDDTWAIPPGGGAGITTINGDSTAAQIMAAGSGLSILDSGATHTYSIGTQTQTLNMGNQLISALLDPVSGTDAANKQYVDNLVNGLSWKDSAVVATTGNITLSGNQTIDGILTVTGDRVLVKDQTSGQFNGLYNSDTGSWTRTADADSEGDLLNMSVYIESGTANNNTSWVLTTDAPIVVDTTVLTYAQIGAGTGNPLTTKGDIFGYDTANARIPVGTDGQVLSADSAEALGVKWITGGGGEVFTWTADHSAAGNDLTNLKTVFFQTGTAIANPTAMYIDADILGAGILTHNVPLNGVYRFEINEDTKMQIGSSTVSLLGKLDLVDTQNVTLNETLNITNQVSGSGYIIMNALASPGNSGFATRGRIFMDSGNSNHLTIRRNDGIDVDLEGGGGAQTPITSDIDYDTFNITDMGIINFVSKADPGNVTSISYATDTFLFHNPSNGGYEFWFGVEGTPKYKFDSNGFWIAGGKPIYGIQSLRAQNSLKVLDFANTTSAVNYFQMTGGTVANGCTLETKANSTVNVDIRLLPKGFQDGSVYLLNRAMKFGEMSTPTAPGGGLGKFYNKDNGGRTAFYIQDDVGETEIALISQVQTLQDKTLDTGTIVNASITWNEFRQTFNPNATIAGLNVGSHTAEPSTPVAGDIFYDSTANQFKGRTNVAWIDLGAGGGGSGDVVGPASAIDNAVARFDGVTGKLIQSGVVTIDDVGNTAGIRSAQFALFNTTPAATVEFIQAANSNLQYNVQSGFGHNFTIAGATEFIFTATAQNFQRNDADQLGAVIFNTSGALTGGLATDPYIEYISATHLQVNVPTGDELQISVNDVEKFTFDTVALNVNGNNVIGVQDIVHDQSAITYAATLAFDFDLDQEQTLAVTGDLTTLTTANRAAGKSKTIFITGDTVNRTLTFNASWRTNPNTATVTINANTFGLLTFGSKGAAETDVFCAYAEFS